MFGARLQIRPIHLGVVTIVGIMLCITLNGLPASAQPSGQFNSHPANWHDNYQNWSARCMPQPNNHGQWGRQRQWDSYCKQNTRYRAAQPDQQWRHNHPWDHGNQSDHGNGLSDVGNNAGGSK